MEKYMFLNLFSVQWLSWVVLISNMMTLFSAHASGGDSPPRSFDEKSFLKIVDQCSEQQTVVLGLNPVKIEFELFGLDPQLPIDFSLEVNFLGDSKEKTPIYSIRRNNLKTNPDGSFNFSRNLVLDEERFYDSVAGRLLEMRLIWSQAEAAHLKGSLVERLYFMSEKNQSFYEVLSEGVESGEPLCMWKKPIKILSQYIFNSDAQDLEVSQEVPSYYLDGEPLQALHVLRDGRDVVESPLMSSEGRDQLGWIFFDFQQSLNTYSPYSIKINRKVSYNSGGYFVKKSVYSRYKARKISAVSSQRSWRECRIWKQAHVGYIDIPRTVYEFVPVSRELVSNQREVEAALNITQAPMNSCSKSFPDLKSGATHFADQSKSRKYEELYFYSE